eukprot:4162900-Pleurochrysis_carterae.AAC.1
MASFRPGGYAAACAASARPAWSRPYATSRCASAPCVQSAIRSAPTWGESAPLCASVVYLRARAPSAHCANVTDPAPVVSNASRMQGSSHMGAWSAMQGHHAGPAASPQSAGFSNAHGIPAVCAARIRSAASAAKRLCFAT